MHTKPTKNRRLAVALLSAPVMLCLAPAAHAQEYDAAEGARPVVMMDGSLTSLGGGVQRSSGSIDPLVGRIRTFQGNLEPFVGRIRTFEGEIDAHKGLIRTFEGDIDPYKGLIRTFWGDLTPAMGDVDPAVGRIRTFSDAFLPQSRELLALWQTAEVTGDYSAVAAQLLVLEQDAATKWGDAVQQRTGKNFADGFSSGFFAKWGVNPANGQSLAGWDAFNRQRFLLEWYDNVLSFSGMDRADHWMNAINWSPVLTQTQGGGSQAVIGLVDFFVANDADVRSKVVYSGGYQSVDNAHGAAVGSLIVASHDGKGIMGIAPRAKVAAYNPFDETLTASWADVTTGIIAVGNAGASVINLSLGVPGYTLPSDWRQVFKTSDVDKLKNKALYVIAAGNDGIVQPTDVNMKDAFDSTFIVVGSIDPNGGISAFSNTPGTACLTDNGDCKNPQVWSAADKHFEKADYLKESGLLMNRFLVAPGEMILVSDGAGGVTRMSGTSFAAPLVSGAIALIHDRWPWLKNHPREVAKIILESAQDLGAPGVDAIYGHGLLDIEAAQSALSFDNLKYYQVTKYGNKTYSKSYSAGSIRSRRVPSSWSSVDIYYSAFEKIDHAERDFLIPLSSRLFGTSLNGAKFQDFMYHRMVEWMNTPSAPSSGGYGDDDDDDDFTDVGRAPALTAANGWRVALRGRTQSASPVRSSDRLKLLASVEVANPQGTMAFAFGNGDGALSLAGARSLQMSGDYDPQLGGANPLLGFASGDAHISTRIELATNLDLSLGVTRQDRSIEQDLAFEEIDIADRVLLSSLDDYQAQATNARLDYRPAEAVTVSVSYTRLKEHGAFFGVRSLEREDFGKGTVSDGLTVSADARVGGGLSLFATGTGSFSNSIGDTALGIDRAFGTAFQAGVAKQSVLGSSDMLRVMLAQPLTLEQGQVEMRTIGVVDRETGEKGIVTQQIDIGAPEQRRYRAELLYGTPMLDGLGEVSLFSSAELRQVRSDVPAFTAGGSFRLAF